MPRSVVELPSFNAVAPGQTATLDIPLGNLYHGLVLTYTTATAGGANQVNMEAELTEFRLKVDGKVQRRFSMAELNVLTGFRGIPFQTGIVPIFFSEPWRRTIQGEDALAWGTADLNTMTLEIDIDAGASSPTLEARGVINRIARPMGPIVKWRKFNANAGGAGLFNIQTLPKIDSYYGVHFATASIDNARALLDQVETWNFTEAQMQAFLTNEGLTPQTGYYHLVWDATNRLADSLPMVVGDRRAGDFRIDLTMAAAASFDYITETLGPRD